MSFFDLPEPQKFFDGGAHEQEDIAVYTWGEESYDGLGDALQERGDELNDETFGGTGPVGKDFDFQQHPSFPLQRDASLSGINSKVDKIRDDAKEPPRTETSKVSSLWDSKSMFSTMPRLKNQGHPQGKASPSTVSIGQTKMRTLAEIEEEMRASAWKSRELGPVVLPRNGQVLDRIGNGMPTGVPSPPQHFSQPVAVNQQRSYATVERQLPQQSYISIGGDFPMYRDERIEQTSDRSSKFPHRVHPPVTEMQELRLHDQHNRIPSHSSTHLRSPSDSLTPDAFSLQQMGYIGHLHTTSSIDAELQHLSLMRQNQQSMNANLEINNYIRSSSRQQMYNMSPDHHEQLKQRATRQIMEQELLEAKRRRKLIKISRMSRNNDLMTQSDKDFITRIQVSQLMMGDPYQEDFYNQVYQTLVRNRVGQGNSLHPKSGPRTGRRQNALQKMEAQVERIINNVRLREKEKDLHSLHHLKGALGKTSGRSYKAAPRQLLQVDGGEVHVGEGQHPTPRIDPTQADSKSHLSTNGIETHQHALLSDKQVLLVLERLYEIVLQLEHMRREQPPPEHIEAIQEWSSRREHKLSEFLALFPLNSSDDASAPHIISFLRPQKGKKLIPRILRQLDKARQLELLILVVKNYSQLDVVTNAALLDDPITVLDREEMERQTDAFMNFVLSNFLPLISDLSLAPINHIFTLLTLRSSLPIVAKSRPGIVLLTALCSHVAHLKHLSTSEGPESMIPLQDLERWEMIYDHIFEVLTPHFTTLFPSTRMMYHARSEQQYLPPPVMIDALDQPIWNFLATFALHSSSEEQQIMVATLRDKILDTVLSANQGWAVEGGSRRIANVNLFLNALGLDASQIAF